MQYRTILFAKELIRLEIKVQNNEVDKALSIFKRMIQKEGLLGEIKKRQFYEKPSVKKRRKSREAAKRKRKGARGR